MGEDSAERDALLRNRIAVMSPEQFEQLVLALVQREHQDVRRMQHPDGGADVVRPATENRHEAEVKALSTAQLGTFLAVCPARSRTLFKVLAATGLRISEAIALRWRDVELDGDSPHVKVRRALVKGRMGPPKSKHGNRSVPIDNALVDELRARRRDSDWPGDDDLVFPAGNGAPPRQENVRRRVLEPTAQEAGVPGVGFHTFRHTCATRLFGGGRNAVQVQRWLGHHSPAFTLSVYVHLLDKDLGAPLESAPKFDAPPPMAMLAD